VGQLILEAAQGSWENVGQLPEGSLINPAVVSFSGNILVFGGGILKAEGLKNTDFVYSFATANRAWTKVSRLPDPIRGAVALSIPWHDYQWVSCFQRWSPPKSMFTFSAVRMLRNTGPIVYSGPR